MPVRYGLSKRMLLPPVLAALALALALIVGPAAAPAAPLVAKDGKIHACYRAKGKGKGTLRVVRSRKVRCPRKWRKVAWSASGFAGQTGPQGEPGPRGEPGPLGERGLPGVDGNVAELETKVEELLTKLQSLEGVVAALPDSQQAIGELQAQVGELQTKVASLEGVLSGLTNAQLTAAVAQVPLVETICAQTEALTSQSNAMGASIGSLNTVLDALVVGFSPVSVPTALAPFTACP